MPGLKLGKPRRRGTSHRIALSVGLAAVFLTVVALPTSAATVTSTWNARLGSGGANGTARIQAFSTGSGALALKLVKLPRSASLAVAVSKGTCKAVGTRVLTLPSIRTTSKGAVTRTLSLSAAHVAAIRAATKGTGKIVIRVGSGTSRKCGAFALVAPVSVGPKVVATIPVGVDPGQATVDASGVWVTNWFDNTLSRIDLTSNNVLSVTPLSIAPSAAPEGITSAFGSLWVTILEYDDIGGHKPGSVIRIDPLTASAIGAPIPVGRQPTMIVGSAEAIWVTNFADASVSRIDPLSNQVVATIPVGTSPLGIGAAFGSIWVANTFDGKVSRIDPATNQVTATIQTQQNAGGLAIGDGSVWVTYCGCGGLQGVVSRIDPMTNAVVAVVPVGSDASLLAFGGGFIWVGVDGDTSVVQIDPATNAVRTRVPVGAKSWGITASDHSVWVVHPHAAGADPSVPVPGSVTRINF